MQSTLADCLGYYTKLYIEHLQQEYHLCGKSICNLLYYLSHDHYHLVKLWHKSKEAGLCFHCLHHGGNPCCLLVDQYECQPHEFLLWWLKGEKQLVLQQSVHLSLTAFCWQLWMWKPHLSSCCCTFQCCRTTALPQPQHIKDQPHLKSANQKLTAAQTVLCSTTCQNVFYKDTSFSFNSIVKCRKPKMYL